MKAKGVCRLLLLVSVSFLLPACATGISGTARSQVTYRGDFSTLQASPGAHVGEVVMLGGKVIDVKAQENLTEIEVLQMPLNGSDRPEDPDRSRGRFLIRSEHFLDPSVYEADKYVTVVGRILGNEPRRIGDFNYVYPIIDPVEIKVWEERRGGVFPNVVFGVGVGASF